MQQNGPGGGAPGRGSDALRKGAETRGGKRAYSAAEAGGWPASAPSRRAAAGTVRDGAWAAWTISPAAWSAACQRAAISDKASSPWRSSSPRGVSP